MVYIDYPLKSPHLVVGGVSLVDRPGVVTRGVCDGYANMIIVPFDLYFHNQRR